ncbi:MAG: DegV family protein, partial [Chloroflexi bacterium]|nr:DegV family protein [Chloroflexota bacterium]
MSKVAIVTDSSPYIPADIIKANQIHVVPLTVIWEEETFYDGVDITRRLTGGRAVFHKNELAYSVVGSIDDPHFGGNITDTYK